MQDVRAILARNVRDARKRLDLSQEDLAARAQLDRTYVSGIERRVRNPTVTVVARIAEALGTSAAALLTEGG